MDPLKNALSAFAEIFALSSFEPEPIQVTRAHEKEAPRVKAAIKRAGDEEVFQFVSAVNRNAFLCGCLDYTILERIEHLIVGYGYRHGSTSKIHAIHHVGGDVGTVPTPDLVERSIRQHGSSDSKAEVVVFHNHPANPVNLALDNLPLTSRTDRHASWRAFKPLQRECHLDL